MNLEVGAHIPLGPWDPYFNLHGGYTDAVMNSESGAINTGIFTVNTGVARASPNGGDFGASLGADYYFTSLVSLGLDLTLDALFLKTSTTYAVPVVGVVDVAQSGTGVAFLGSLHVGFHFNL